MIEMLDEKGILGREIKLMSKKIGVLFCSYGDIDSKEQLKDFYRKSVETIGLSEVPTPLKEVLSLAIWELKQSRLREEYEKLTPPYRTEYRQNCQNLAEKVKQKLKGVNTYVGFNFINPSISQALAQVREDNIEHLFVIYHGAQYSKETTEISFNDIRQYLQSQVPPWKIKITGIRSFVRDDRFVNLVETKLKNNIEQHFPGIDSQDLCIFLPVHGVGFPKFENEEEIADPYFKQTQDLIEIIKDDLKSHQYHVEYGFQNHDYHPPESILNYINWTKPEAKKIAQRIHNDAFRAVLIDGSISFLIDSKETLVDQKVDLVGIIEGQTGNNGIAGGNQRRKIRAVFSSSFNADDALAEYLSLLIKDAIQEKGDLVRLN